MKTNGIIYLLLFIVLVWYHCFAYVGFQVYGNSFNILSYFLSIFLFLLSFREISFKRHKIPTLIFLSTIISMFASMILWEQNVMDVFKAFINYYLVLVFFFLYAKKAAPEKVEKALVILAIVYVACWIYQVISVPTLIFGVDRDADITNTDARGFYRFWIPTKENMPILALFFYELYRRTKKQIYLILVPIFFFIVVLHVGRQMMFWSFISLVLFILYTNKKKWKKIVISSVIIYFLFNLMVENIPTLNLLFEQTETQMDSVSDDIRTKAIDFYWKESIKNPIGFLFGNGVGRTGELGYFTKKAEMNGFYESDIGYFSLLFDFGLLGLLSYVLLFIQILRMKVEDKYFYLKCYLVYVYGSYTFAHCLTTNILFNMCAIYILYKSNELEIRHSMMNKYS